MKKNVDEACETLESAKVDLEKATLVDAMESKAGMVVTKIQRKINIAKRDLERNTVLDSKRRI